MRKRRRGVFKRLTQMVFSREQWRSWLLPRSIRNYEREVGDGTGSSTIMAPLLWIGRNFPEAPPMVWDTASEPGQEEPIPDHEMLRLLVRPNPYYSGAVLWMATLADWHLDGNAYWIKVRNEAGVVKQLWWTPSTLMEPRGDEQTFIDHYDYTPHGMPIPLDPEDVVHFRYGLDVEDPRRGRSPLKSVLREVFTDDEAANYTASLLANMGVPGVVLSPEGDTPPAEDDVEATKEYMKDKFTGDKRGEPIVFSGPTKVDQFGYNPKQMDLKSLRRIPEERCTAVIGIPAIVCGLGAGLDRSTFSNYGEAREAAFEDNLIPSQRIIGEEIRFQLLPDFEDDPWRFRCGFDLTNVRVLSEDRNRVAERMSVGVKAGYIRVAEARRETGFEADDADEIYLRGLNQIEVPAGEGGARFEISSNGSEPDGLESSSNGAGVKQSQRDLQRLIIAFERDARVVEAVFMRELEEDFEDLGRIASETYASMVSSQALSAAGNVERKEITDEALAAQIVAAMETGEFVDDRLRLRFEGNASRTLKRTQKTINDSLSLGVNIPDEVERGIIAEGGTRRGLMDVPKQTRGAITRAIADGREAGENPLAIARRIREEVPAGQFVNAGPSYRAQLIARTETKWAQNRSALAAYKSAENVTAVQAYDARLGETDEDCTFRDGQIFSLEAADIESGLEHPNGTLSFAPIVNPRDSAEVIT